jgi:hypothetical protein
MQVWVVFAFVVCFGEASKRRKIPTVCGSHKLVLCYPPAARIGK